MTTGLDSAVELLDRSLAYTRVALADIQDDDLGRATPCPRWSLAALLAHMEDALDAFTEAAGGEVLDEGESRAPGVAVGPRVERLQAKACALLGAWAVLSRTPSAVAIGDRGLAAPLLLGAAALEITVHGWDVGRATGRGDPVPDPLAEGLLRVAGVIVPPGRHDGRFGTPVSLPPTAGAGSRLLAEVGRHPSGPVSANRPVHAPRRSPAS